MHCLPNFTSHRRHNGYSFVQPHIPHGKLPKDTYHRLKGLYQHWMTPVMHSKEQILTVILEQMLQMLPNYIKTWLKEHEPGNGLTAAKLAQYLNARKGVQPKLRKPDPRGFMSDVKKLPARAVTIEEVFRVNTHQVLNGLKSQINGLKSQRPCLFSLSAARASGFTLSHERAETVQLLLCCLSTSRVICLLMLKMTVLTSAFVNGQPVNALLDTGSSVSFIKH